MAKDLVSPIPAPATPSEMAAFLDELETAAGWVQPVVVGAEAALGTVLAAGVAEGEVAAVDADPPIALLGVACIVFIFGAGLFLNAIGALFASLPWPLSTFGTTVKNIGDRIITYGVDIVKWMVDPLIQLFEAAWHGLDHLLGLGLGTAAQLGLAIYKMIQEIMPHQIAANDTGIAAAAASAINDIIAVAPDYQMKATKAGHTEAAALMQAIPRLVPSTTAGAVLALALSQAANTEIVDECALPWCDTVESTDTIQKDLGGLLAGLLGAGIFCRLVSDPAGAAAAIARDSNGFLVGLGGAMVVAGDPVGALYAGVLDVIVNDPAGAAAFIARVVC